MNMRPDVWKPPSKKLNVSATIFEDMCVLGWYMYIRIRMYVCEREREGERDGECVCVCVCVCVWRGRGYYRCDKLIGQANTKHQHSTNLYK